jgi:hypothetical protein
MPNVLQEYLIALRPEVDYRAVAKFRGTLELIDKSVADHMGGMAGTFLKAGTAIVGTITGISAAIIGIADSAAAASQSYRLMALHQLMTVQSTMKLDMITKGLGASLAEIRWDPELGIKANVLSGQFDAMYAAMHKTQPLFEQNMLGLRNFRYEAARLGMQWEILKMSFASALFEKVGGGKILEKIDSWVTRLQNAIPRIADELATDAVPVLRTTWELFKAIGSAVKEGAVLFTNLVGIISGDNSLKSSEFSFHNLSVAIRDVLDWLTKLVDKFRDSEAVLGHGALAINAALHGRFGEAGKEAGLAVHGEPTKYGPNGEVIEKGTRGLGIGSGLLAAFGGMTGLLLMGKLWKGTIGRGIGAISNIGSKLFNLGSVTTYSAAEAAAAREAIAAVSTTATTAISTSAAAAESSLIDVVATAGKGVQTALAVESAAVATEISTASTAAMAQIGTASTAAAAGIGAAVVSGVIAATGAALVGIHADFDKFGPKSKGPEDTANRWGYGGYRRIAQAIGLGGLFPQAAGVGAATGQPAATMATPGGAGSYHRGDAHIPMAALVERIFIAISRVEAGGKPNAISIANNNPGNLRSWGNTPIEHGFAKFGTLAEGVAADKEQIRKNIARGLTLYEFFAGKPGVYAGYSPATDRNNPMQYAMTVARESGLPADVPLNQIASAAGGMVVPGGVGALLAMLHPKEWVLPASITSGLSHIISAGSALMHPQFPEFAMAGGGAMDFSQMYAEHQRAPEVAQRNTTVHVTFGNINVGGVQVTQPGANMHDIRRQVGEEIEERLRHVAQYDLVNLSPLW